MKAVGCVLIFIALIASEKMQVRANNFPTVMNITEGANVTLACTFEKIMQCRWMRNDQTMCIEGPRFSYLKVSNAGCKQYATKDCSIQITKFDSGTDNGTWKCQSNENNHSIFELKAIAEPNHLNKKASLPTKDILSNFAIDEKLNSSENETIIIINEGDSVTLNCKFSKAQQCSWKKDGNSICIKKPLYSFLNNISLPCSPFHPTTDCSIQITSFNADNDSGSWRCFKPATDDVLIEKTWNIYKLKSSDKLNTTNVIVSNSSGPNSTFEDKNVIHATFNYGVMIAVAVGMSCGAVVIMIIAVNLRNRVIMMQAKKEANPRSCSLKNQCELPRPLPVIELYDKAISPRCASVAIDQNSAEDVDGYLLANNVNLREKTMSKNRQNISSISSVQNHVYEYIRFDDNFTTSK